MLCLGYQSKWNGGHTCKFSDEKCHYTHAMCGSQAEYDALKKRVEDGKVRSSDESDATATRTEFSKKFCKYGQTCRAHKEGKCSKDHSYKSNAEFKKALREVGLASNSGLGSD